MIELTYDTTVELLDGLVAEAGEEFVYARGEDGRCNYVRDGKPSCIVGHVLAKVGVPVERLKLADTTTFGGGTAADLLIHLLKDEGVLKAGTNVPQLLGFAQYYQDSAHPWSKAVAAAKDDIAKL